MSAEQVANKLWGLCNLLRDDGVLPTTSTPAYYIGIGLFN